MSAPAVQKRPRLSWALRPEKEGPQAVNLGAHSRISCGECRERDPFRIDPYWPSPKCIISSLFPVHLKNPHAFIDCRVASVLERCRSASRPAWRR